MKSMEIAMSFNRTNWLAIALTFVMAGLFCVLISGGAGYLGTELTKNLIKNYKVIVYDKLYFPWLYKNKILRKHKN